jgi:hypothetical protein
MRLKYAIINRIRQNTSKYEERIYKYDYRRGSRREVEVQQYESQNPGFSGRAVAEPCEAVHTISRRIKD